MTTKRRRSRLDGADARAGSSATTVRLSPVRGAITGRKLAGERHADPAAVAKGRADRAEQEAKRLRFGHSQDACHRRRAEHPDHV